MFKETLLEGADMMRCEDCKFSCLKMGKRYCLYEMRELLSSERGCIKGVYYYDKLEGQQ